MGNMGIPKGQLRLRPSPTTVSFRLRNTPRSHSQRLWYAVVIVLAGLACEIVVAVTKHLLKTMAPLLRESLYLDPRVVKENYSRLRHCGISFDLWELPNFFTGETEGF